MSLADDELLNNLLQQIVSVHVNGSGSEVHVCVCVCCGGGGGGGGGVERSGGSGKHVILCV